MQDLNDILFSILRSEYFKYFLIFSVFAFAFYKFVYPPAYKLLQSFKRQKYEYTPKLVHDKKETHSYWCYIQKCELCDGTVNNHYKNCWCDCHE